MPQVSSGDTAWVLASAALVLLMTPAQAFFYEGVVRHQNVAGTIPHQAFMVFQAMFAIITPALIVSAFAERMKFKPLLIFILLWATLVYDTIAHWVWGVGRWLRNLVALDFAGGTVVHISSGVAALAAVLVSWVVLPIPSRRK